MAYYKIRALARGSSTDPVIGFDTFPASGTKHVYVGFRPAYLVITRATATTTTADMIIYSKDYSTTKCRMAWSNGYAQDSALPNTNAERLASIDDTGFTVTNGVDRQFQFVAIPENYGGNVAIGEFTYSTSGTIDVVLGFKPEYMAILNKASGTTFMNMQIYSEDYSTTKFRFANTSSYAQDVNLNGTSNDRLKTINDNGFTINKASQSATQQYIAVGRIPKTPKFPVIGTSTYPTSGTKRIELGFKPAYLAITKAASSSSTSMQIFSRDYATDKFRDANGSSYAKDTNFGTTSDTRIFSIDESGFTIDKFTSAQEFQYIAVPRDYKGNVKVGTITLSASTQTHISCGFKPKYLFTTKTASSASTNMMIYSEDYSTTQYRRAHSSSYTRDQVFEQAGSELLYSIDNDGFTINSASSAVEIQYIAIGELSEPAYTKTGVDSYPASGTKYIHCGFKPAYVILSKDGENGADEINIYSANFSRTQIKRATATTNSETVSLQSGLSNTIYSVDDEGFTISAGSGTFKYVAVPFTPLGNTLVADAPYSPGFPIGYVLDFTPKIVAVVNEATGGGMLNVYNADYSTTNIRKANSLHPVRDEGPQSAEGVITVNGNTVNALFSEENCKIIFVG